MSCSWESLQWLLQQPCKLDQGLEARLPLDVVACAWALPHTTHPRGNCRGRLCHLRDVRGSCQA